MFQKTIFPNGLRLVTQTLASTKAATVLILVGAGSRYETKEINGISHFLEHMFFKGAKKYPTSRAVSETIDGMGGDFNAFTGKEYVGYYVKANADHIDTSLDVLSDMLIHAKHDSVEIDKERNVIWEEYNMYLDTPMYQIGWDFEKLVYGDQPMGWDQVGTHDVIFSLKQEDFQKYQSELYTPDNLVVIITGNVTHEAMVEKVQKFFAELPNKKQAYSHKDLQLHVAEKRVFLRTKKTEQSHICVGFPMVSEADPDYAAMKVLSVILGGGMSSRMFMSVREDKGLAYYTHSSVDGFTDSGLFTTNAGVDVKRIDDALAAVIGEYDKVTQELVPEKELRKAKEYIKGKTILKLEDCEEYAHLLGKYDVLYGKIRTPDELLEEIEKVTAEDLLRLAKQFFVREKMFISVIGPYEDEAQFTKFLG
ncbi:MAG: pitrilysin family protein [Patescibacteria group bacterium]